MELSIVVPACNEENRIGRMLDAYLPHFAKLYEEVEFLVVVNGSTDGTETVVRGYEAQYPQLRVIVESERIGKGGALLLGLDQAHGDLIGFVDADGATAPESFQDLVDLCRGPVGAVIGSRWIRGAKVTIKQTMARRFASRCFNLCTRLLFGLNISDTQCGAKVLTREALADVLPRIGTTQWAFDVDLLYQLKRAGYHVHELPTEWHDVKGSTLRVGRASLNMFAALVRLRLMHSPFKGLVNLYSPKLDVLGRLRQNPPR